MIQNKDLERIKNQRLENDGIHTENKAGGTVSEKQHELYTDHCVGVFFPYIDRGIIAPSPDCDERGGEYEFFKRVIYRNDIYLRDRTGGCGYGDTLDFVRSAGHTVFVQVGGLGFMTMGVVFAMFLKKRISLSIRGLVQESMNANQVGGMVKLVRNVFIRTLIIEGIGAALLAIRFIPRFGILRGVYFSVFHSVSAFCNAGIDLMGPVSGEYSSLVDYVDDPLVNFVICGLIIVGGIGF